jgi:hypothetical protein
MKALEVKVSVARASARARLFGEPSLTVGLLTLCAILDGSLNC